MNGRATEPEFSRTVSFMSYNLLLCLGSGVGGEGGMKTYLDFALYLIH